MKTFTKIATAFTLTIAAAGASALEFQATDKYVTTNLCMAAAEGSKMNMRHAIKDSNLSKHFIVKNVKCNDQDFLAFTQQYNENSDKIIEMLNGNSQQRSITITDIVAN
jgi:hypothetical protein